MSSFIIPRGIRNNNPGNIRLSKTLWQGQKSAGLIDKIFAEFSTPVMGLRALMILLLNYYIKYELDSVESIINRFAPPCENATDNYMGDVCNIMNVTRREKINLTDAEILKLFAKAIVRHENGKPAEDMPDFWYEDALYDEASKMALERK